MPIFALLPGERGRTPAPSGSDAPAWLVYALKPAHLSGDSEICMGEVWSCSSRNYVFVQFPSPQLVFQTLKNYNFLFKVTLTYSSPLSTSLCLTRTILSTHKIRLLIFASWHLSSSAFQEGDLWETLSST